MAEHSVIVHLKLTGGEFGTPCETEAIHALEDQITAAVEQAEVGEFDGDEFGAGESSLYLYGPRADPLFAAIEPILAASPLARGGYAILRYGDAANPRAREVRKEL